jgi:hypothetical protein
MIDLILNNLYLLGAALIVGIVTGRWAFSKKKAATPAAGTPAKEEDETAS